ncbi:MAG: hypothetical protein IJ873_03415 [Lachnospiraceae bacterium]|nr:hypothetical protein [Lachnospiraceae bacterium]
MNRNGFRLNGFPLNGFRLNRFRLIREVKCRYVNRAVSLINAGSGEAYYQSNVKAHLHDFIGKVFEKMAKEYLFNLYLFTCGLY